MTDTERRTMRAAIFDMDGTLLNTLEDLADSGNYVLASRGYATHPTEAYKYFVGSGIRELARRVLPPDARTPEVIAELTTAFKEHYATCWDNKTRAYDGIPELLAGLRQRGIPTAVCTNKPDSFAQINAKRFFPDTPFDVVMGLHDATPPKPNPFLPLEAARLLQVAPEDCAYLGDTSVDMQTGNNAGMFTIGVLWGFRPEEELLEHGAQLLLEHPLELFDKVLF